MSGNETVGVSHGVKCQNHGMLDADRVLLSR